MLYLYTGTPGSSKTLNAIKFICEEPSFQNRPVYFFNIKEVTHPWIELTEEECLRWYELPENSIVFIDECQKIFRPRQKAAKVPRHVEELETHRHLGIDIVVCTQSTDLVDKNLLAQVEMHRHLERRYGKEQANQFQWEKAITTVNAKAHRSQAVMTTIKFDQKYYGTYKSAEVHTRKASVPLKLRLIQSAIVLTVIGFMAFFINLYWGAKHAAEDAPVQASTSQSTQQLTPVSQEEIDPNSLIPRIPQLPWTAPAYDEITKAKSAPMPRACVYWHQRDYCVCYTQQGTKMSVPRTFCMQTVKGGYFDRTIPDQFSIASEDAQKPRNSNTHKTPNDVIVLPDITKGKETVSL